MPAQPDCLFCKIVAGELPAYLIAEDERTIAFLDINPARPGHALVVPREHCRDLIDVDAKDLAAVALTAQRVAGGLQERLRADGVNLISSCGAAAWQVIFHFHVHVIPRFEGDKLRHPWIPAPADPDELAAVAARLR
ncbi:MAG: HIT family protein [Solirubrobacteraceae bacterium]